MTMTNAEWCIKQGYKFSDLYIYGKYNNDHNWIWHIQLFKADIDEISNEDAIIDVLTAWLDAEHVEPILDDVEKRYLSAVIRPFSDKIYTISKMSGVNGNYEWLEFTGKDEYGIFYLPNFKAGTMYKGMKLGRKYTLEELGL